jgi:hypothetical protein
LGPQKTNTKKNQKIYSEKKNSNEKRIPNCLENNQNWRMLKNTKIEISQYIFD